MDTRCANFEGYASHPWLARVFSRLNEAELALCRAFLQEKAALDKGAFEMAVNRMFLDQQTKPKHYKEISELLSCANSALK